MWLLTTGTISAIGKEGLGTPLRSASTSVKSEAPFADWLQASLLSEIPLEQRSGVNTSQSVIVGIPSAQDELSQESLDTLLQSWLAALFQPLLIQADAQAGSLPNAPIHQGAESTGEHSTYAMNQLHLKSQMSQGLFNTLEGESVVLFQQWLRGITLSSGTPLSAAVVPLPDRAEGNQDLLHLLQTFLQQQGDQSDQFALPPFASDTLKMIRAYLQEAGGQAMAGQNLHTVEVDGGQQSDIANQRLNLRINEQDPFMVNLAKEFLMKGVSARSGSGRDGTSGQTENEMAGNVQPSLTLTSSTQGIASAERSFLQWLTQTGSPAQAEAGSQNPVRDIAQPFANVRLLLSRFDTLEGRGYEARFQLYPEQLGKVHVKLILHQGILQAQLFVDNRLAREILEGQLQALQQAFAQQGLQVDKIHVAISEASPFQWHEQSASFYNEQDPFMVNLAKEFLMKGVSARSGSGQDGTSRQTENEMAGNVQPSLSLTSSTQGIASAERSFLQWLTQTGSPAQAEAGSQSPVQDIAQPFPNVRLLLSRFDTLEGRGYEARFQLYPEQLGTVHVKLVLHQGILQAQLYVDNRMARDILEGQLQTLQQAFAQQGLQVDKINVALREDSPFQWYDQGASFYQEQHNNANQQHRDGHASSAASRYQGIVEDEAGGQDLRRDRPASLYKGIDMSV